MEIQLNWDDIEKRVKTVRELDLSSKSIDELIDIFSEKTGMPKEQVEALSKTMAVFPEDDPEEFQRAWLEGMIESETLYN